MLSTIWAGLLYVGVAYAGVASRTQTAVQSLITAAASEDELRKRYIIYDYYTPDWTDTMTCGVIQAALAVQAGFYGTKTAASITAAPYPITCDGICADSGNHLGCINWTGKTVGTTCVDYSPTNTACDFLDDGPCYWDTQCESGAPACVTLIYSGTITQYTCGLNKVAPITVDSASMTPYTPSPSSTSSNLLSTGTNAAATSTSTSDPSVDSASLSSFEKALKKVGLSVGALAGICAGALVACCGACCGWATWKKRRDGKKKYAAPYGHEPVNPATIVQQPLMGQPPAYHNRYHHKQPEWTAVPQPYNQYER